MTIDHTQLRRTAQAYAALARRRRDSRLTVSQLIDHQRLLARLCELTGESDAHQAWRQVRQLLEGLPASPADVPADQAPVAPGGTAATGEPASDQPLCVVCDKPLGKRVGVHNGCRPVACLGCGKVFPKATLTKLRCWPCGTKTRRRRTASTTVISVTAAQRTALRQATTQRTKRTAAVSSQRRKRPATPMDIAQKPLWFGRVLAWSAAPGEPLHHTRYAGVEYVIERVGQLTADHNGVFAGWYLQNTTTATECADQLGDHLAENLSLAKQLAEVRIVTGCSTYSDSGQPPNLLTVMHGVTLLSSLSVGGTTMPVVILPAADRPVVRVHRHDLVTDPRVGVGGLLGEIRVKIHRSAGAHTDPVTLVWTVHTAAGRAVGTHACWDAAYADLATLLDSTRVANKDVVCTKCGNHGNHMCGRDWRLANGRIAKRPRGGSVRAVNGGLPSLGR